MATFGTSLAEAFGTIETLENQNNNPELKKLEHTEKHMQNVCSKKCMDVYSSAHGNPTKEDVAQFCSTGCVNVSKKIKKEVGPISGPVSGPGSPNETALKESFSTIEGMNHRHPRPGPPHHGPMRPHHHHGDRRVEIIQEVVPSVILRNIRKNLDLVILLVVLVVLLVVGLVVMRK